MLTARALAVAVIIASGASCTTKRDAPAPPPTASSTGAASAAAAATLPPGALVELVPSPGELPPGFAVVEGGAGPVDITAVADLSDDPEAAQQALRGTGFKDGYSVDYGNEQTGAFVSVQVLRFGDAAGGHADYERGVRESAAAAEPIPLTTVGEESAAFRSKLPEGDVAEIVTFRFRVRDLVWLVETGGQDSADSALAHDIATNLVKRTA